MNDRTIACVMEQTLGNITHYLNLRRHEDALAGFAPRWLPVEYSAGPIARVPWTVTGGLAARRALKPHLKDVDGVFIHTTTLALLNADNFRRKPTVLSTDGTPMNKRHMRGDYGLKSESSAQEKGKRLLYRQLFGQARGFVGWSNWAKQSFVEDYGCRDEDVVVIPPGIDLDQFVVPERKNELPRILFVGGDFERKGGDLLLNVFRRGLLGKAELDLVTRSNIAPERGVRVYNDVAPNSDALLKLYRDADIFVLPTRADCFSLVCMEALASGLPVVTTRVGGIPDMLEEGKTGHVLDVDDADALADVLTELAENPGRRREMGLLGRQAAETRFDARQNARALFEFVRSRCC
ncbi:glycosyltransferase family 4 protein [Hyphomicrobium facile]|uniref:Glycosyltransferase involved in cell wall bisynthesis n=1 Tax=Hyphomicrobium facile TaxID=51670 RepID=A0A1I7NFG7_9HYPH|nr:glycosyltransferase family 4 protein [Hyphomicrobium facile]SFV33398.1 Glycosyltransferase involved in cell wall bisynthesis [Hyphomicrobium facile]